MNKPDWKQYYTEENIRFSGLMENYMATWGVVLQFQHLAQVGFPDKTDYLSNYIRESLEKMKPGSEWDGILLDPGSFFAGDNPDRLAKEYALQYISNALSVSNASSLVFGHSLLDALLNEYLDLIVSLEANVFHRFIRDQKISCEAVIEGSHEEALLKKVHKHVGKLKRDSLLDRADVFHQVCKPPPEFFSKGLYKYDPDRLKAIDQLRHEIIHLPRPNARELNLNIEDDLLFLQFLGTYFMALMNHRFGLKIIPLPRKE